MHKNPSLRLRPVRLISHSAWTAIAFTALFCAVLPSSHSPHYGPFVGVVGQSRAKRQLTIKEIIVHILSKAKGSDGPWRNAYGGGWGRNGNPSIRASRSAHGEAHVSPRNVYAYLMISAKSQPCNPRRDLIKSPMPDRVPRTKVDHMPMNCILLNASVICCRSTLLSDPLPCPFFHRLNARH